MAGSSHEPLAMKSLTPTTGRLTRAASRRITSMAPCLLLELSDEILEKILWTSAPKILGSRWLWLSRLASTCQQLRTFAMREENVGEEFDLLASYVDEEYDDPDDEDAVALVDARLRVPLIRSFIDAKWKGAALSKVSVTNFAALCDGNNASPTIINALRQLLTTPGVLPNLEWLEITVDCDWDCGENFNLVDAKFLHELAIALPKLDSLDLSGCFNNKKYATPAALRTFGRALQQPLACLTFGGCRWLDDKHLVALLPFTDLEDLHLTKCYAFDDSDDDSDDSGSGPSTSQPKTCVTDAGLKTIAKECDHLHALTLTYLDRITVAGVQTVLRSTGHTLCHLNLSVCHGLHRSVCHVISKHAPSLWSFRANYCSWFDDEGLMQLVTSQVHKREEHALVSKRMLDELDPQRTGVSLRAIGVYNTSVTVGGLRRAFEAAPGVLGCPSFLGGWVEIGMYMLSPGPEDGYMASWHRSLAPQKAEWSALAADFPDVRFREARDR